MKCNSVEFHAEIDTLLNTLKLYSQKIRKWLTSKAFYSNAYNALT